MASIGSIVLGIEANTKGFDKGLEHSGTAFQKFEHQLKGIKGTLGALGVLEAVHLFKEFGEAVYEAGEKMFEFVERGIQTVTTTALLAHRLGASVEGFGQLAYAARLSGVDMDSLGLALQKMQVNLGDTLLQINPALKALERLGLNATDLANMQPDQAFKKIATAISKLPNDALKASVAVDIFGRSGATLLNVLNEGEEGINKWADEASRLGVAFSGLDASRVHEAHAAMLRVGAVVEGVANLIAIELSPYIIVATKRFMEWANTGVSMSLIVKAGLYALKETIIEVIRVTQALIGPLSYLVGGDWGDAADEWFNEFAEEAQEAAAHVHEAHEAVESMIPETDKLGDKVADLTKSLKLQSETFGMSATAASIYKLQVEGATEAQLELARSYAAVIEQQEKQKGINAISDKLKEQIDLYGKTAREIELWKAAQMGASEEELKAMKAMVDKLDALDAQKKATEDQEKYMDNLKKKAENFYEQTRTPLEKYQAEIKELDELLASGMLDQDTYNRAVKSAEEKISPREETHDKKFAGAVQLGSAEGRSAILNNRLGSQKKDKTPLDQLAEAKKTNGLLATIAGAKPDIYIIAP